MRGEERRVIRCEGLIASLDDVRMVCVTTRSDRITVFVRDVARAAFGLSFGGYPSPAMTVGRSLLPRS